MNRRRPWTDQEQHDLLQWADQGISLERIAVRLNRTVMAVQNRLYALKGKGKPDQGQADPLTE
jgi:DNA-binding CsgD family transcriptional regulator